MAVSKSERTAAIHYYNWESGVSGAEGIIEHGIWLPGKVSVGIEHQGPQAGGEWFETDESTPVVFFAQKYPEDPAAAFEIYLDESRRELYETRTIWRADQEGVDSDGNRLQPSLTDRGLSEFPYSIRYMKKGAQAATMVSRPRTSDNRLRTTERHYVTDEQLDRRRLALSGAAESYPGAGIVEKVRDISVKIHQAAEDARHFRDHPIGDTAKFIGRAARSIRHRIDNPPFGRALDPR